MRGRKEGGRGCVSVGVVIFGFFSPVFVRLKAAHGRAIIFLEDGFFLVWVCGGGGSEGVARGVY